jgi:hypothetical protein
MIESTKHFLAHWYSWPIAVVASAWIFASAVTVVMWLLGPDPAPTIEELERDGKITTGNEPKGGKHD